MNSVQISGRGTRRSSFCSRCALLGLSGCAAARLRTDYGGYENAYANSSNREMLLNLARLNQHDPTFFFKIGQITTTYRMTASVNGNGSQVTQGTATGTNISEAQLPQSGSKRIQYSSSFR